jgi:hypothetical protein
MAKIFIGIALVAILATAVFGFLTKSNVQGLRDKTTDAVTKMNKAEGTLQVKNVELKKAQEDVTAAKAAADEKDKEATAKAAQVDTLTKQLADAKTALDDKDAQLKKAIADASAPKAEAPQVADPAIAAATARADKAEAELAEAKQVEETINRKLKDNDSKMAALEQYKRDREIGLQRPGVTGRILAVNPGWNFVVLNIGDKQGLMTDSPLLVTRGGEPIAKVRVTSIETSKAIADVIPGSVREGVSVQPGDRVVYQGSRTEKLHVTEPSGAGAPSSSPASGTAPATGSALPN